MFIIVVVTVVVNLIVIVVVVPEYDQTTPHGKEKEKIRRANETYTRIVSGLANYLDDIVALY